MEARRRRLTRLNELKARLRDVMTEISVTLAPVVVARRVLLLTRTRHFSAGSGAEASERDRSR